MLIRETGLSLLAIQIILKRHGFRKIKLIRKPRLTLAIKAKSYKFVLAYCNWTLEDWKAVIWINKISIILGYR